MTTAVHRSPKLLDQMRNELPLMHYAWKTENSNQATDEFLGRRLANFLLRSLIQTRAGDSTSPLKFVQHLCVGVDANYIRCCRPDEHNTADNRAADNDS